MQLVEDNRRRLVPIIETIIFLDKQNVSLRAIEMTVNLVLIIVQTMETLKSY